MSEKTPIEILLDAAHEASIIHFPQGINVVRANGAWEARFVAKAGEPSPYTVKCGKTPEAAIEALRAHVASELASRANLAKRERERYENAAALLGRPGVEVPKENA